MSTQAPVVTTPNDETRLNIGGSQLVRKIRSDDTNGAFSVVEFVSKPGEGVGLHTHSDEDELVYLLEGEIEVTLGDTTMTATPGTCALLPKDIPHGYVNIGNSPSRLLAVLLPGNLDNFFLALSRELAADREHEEHITKLCQSFGLTFHS
ncbi:MAG: cupin domain-containing protein [Phycisphaera sp.]|nr:MAG: cupin domain-containing protein [Phycisphaera sp.]